ALAQPANAAVGPDDAVFDLAGLAGPQSAERLHPAGPVVGMDDFLPAGHVGGKVMGRPAREVLDDGGEVAIVPSAPGGPFRAPEAVGDGGEDPAQLRLHALEAEGGLVLLAHIAGGDQGEGARLEVQAGDGDVDGDPDAFLTRAEQKTVLGVEDSRL